MAANHGPHPRLHRRRRPAPGWSALRTRRPRRARRPPRRGRDVGADAQTDQQPCHRQRARPPLDPGRRGDDLDHHDHSRRLDRRRRRPSRPRRPLATRRTLWRGHRRRRPHQSRRPRHDRDRSPIIAMGPPPDRAGTGRGELGLRRIPLRADEPAPAGTHDPAAADRLRQQRTRAEPGRSDRPAPIAAPRRGHRVRHDPTLYRRGSPPTSQLARLVANRHPPRRHDPRRQRHRRPARRRRNHRRRHQRWDRRTGQQSRSIGAGCRRHRCPLPPPRRRHRPSRHRIDQRCDSSRSDTEPPTSAGSSGNSPPSKPAASNRDRSAAPPNSPNSASKPAASPSCSHRCCPRTCSTNPSDSPDSG